MALEDGSLESLAAQWLALERRSTRSGRPEDMDAAARAAAAYERSVRGASLEDLQLAWRSAEKAREACLIGTSEWAEARAVAQLLRLEYESARS
jgi:hypothetical protein